MTTDELLQRWSDGSITADELRELTAKLAEPEHQNALLDDWLLESSLPDRLPGASVASLTEAMRTTRRLKAAELPQTSMSARWLSWRPLALAAAAVVVLGLTWWMLGQTKDDAAAIVTVLFAEDCQWKKPNVICEGERLVPQMLSLAKGMAVVRFDGGAEMLLRGETELELQSATQAKLLRGDVIVRAEGDAAGFKLDTPSASLLDLGTEFAVKVNGGAATELRVSEGEVAYAHGGVTKTLQAGKAVRLERSKAPKSITGDAPRFDQLVREANPRERADLMIVHEGFQYDEGSYAPSSITKGKGWAGPWRLRSEQEMIGRSRPDTTTAMRIVQGLPILPWRMNRGGIGMLEMPTGVCVRIRPMTLPLEMNRDGITYFSMITQEPQRPSPASRENQESVRLTFRSSADFASDFLSFGYGPNQKPYISGASFGNTQSLSPIPDGQSLLWIGKIIRRAEGDDEISFRIYGQDEALDYAEPKTWHVNSRSVRMKAALDLLVLSSTGNAPRMVDEIRIGSTWRSVVPISSLRAFKP